MGIAGLLAYNSIRHMDIIKHSISNVDDILLIICIPCILLYAFFSMVPSVLEGDILFVSVYILQVVQATLQTVLIGDGLRRCSNSSSLQQKKPGREVITFLVVANVALWLLETFEIKSDAGNADKYEFYGKVRINQWILIYAHKIKPCYCNIFLKICLYVITKIKSNFLSFFPSSEFVDNAISLDASPGPVLSVPLFSMSC